MLVEDQHHTGEILSTPPYYIRYVSSEIVKLIKPMHVYQKLSQGKIRTNVYKQKTRLLTGFHSSGGWI